MVQSSTPLIHIQPTVRYTGVQPTVRYAGVQPTVCGSEKCLFVFSLAVNNSLVANLQLKDTD